MRNFFENLDEFLKQNWISVLIVTLIAAEIYLIFFAYSSQRHYTVYFGVNVRNEMRLISTGNGQAVFEDNGKHRIVIGCPYFAEEEL